MRRTAPAYQALGGLSLALVCSPIGEHLGQWSLASTDPSETHVETIAAGPAETSAPARAAAPQGDGCSGASHCQTLLTSGGFFAGVDHLPASAVSSEGLGDHEAKPGQGIRVAMAGTSQPSTATSASAQGPRPFAAPAIPAMPSGPATTGVEPAVTALFEPTAVEPIVTAGAPDADTTPEAVVPRAGTTPGDLFNPQGVPQDTTPFKPGGDYTPDKPEGRAAAPLPGNSPLANWPPTGGPATPNEDGPPVPPTWPGDEHAPDPGPGGSPDIPWLVPVLGPPGPVSSPPNPMEPLFSPVLDPIVNPPLGPDDPLDNLVPSDLVVAAAVPEPTSLALLAIAAMGLAGIGRTRRR